MTFFLGLDLGQAADPTAIAVLERIAPPGTTETEEKYATLGLGYDAVRRPPPGPAAHQEYAITHLGAGGTVVVREASGPTGEQPQCTFQGRHLERLRLGTSYPDVATHVKTLLETAPLKGKTQLVVDATGVGRPVVDMLRLRGLDPVSVTIHGGDQVVYERGWRVPKRDLVGAVQVLLQTERLKFADQIPAVPALVQELMAFRVKIDPLTAHDSYGSWREGAHDDLVLATAIAAWWGLRWKAPRPLPGSRWAVTHL